MTTPKQAAGAGLGPAATDTPPPVVIRAGAGGGGRAWRIELPARMDLLNANHRTHWRKRANTTRLLRAAAFVCAKAAKVPPLQRAHVVGIYEPPNKRRRDAANLYPSFKAAIDGLVDAGVLPDDDSAHLDGPDMRLGPVHPGGRLVLIVTELEVRDAARRP